MFFGSLILLLVAAVLHAIANALMKQARDKLAFVWWMLGIFCILCLPSLFFIPKFELAAYGIVLASGLLEAVYFLTLSRAYTEGDLSVVYPIARGSAQLFLLLWATLFIGERPSAWGLAGIFAILCGIYIINLPSISDWKRPLQSLGTPASRWALLTGILISGYTAIDKIGIRYFPPFLYLYLTMLVCWCVLALQWMVADRRVALWEEIKGVQTSDWSGGVWVWIRQRWFTSILFAAIFGTTAYLLVLIAMRLSPVSYVGPVREVSVVIGAWIGIRFMAEKGGALRIAASVLVALGIAFIAIAG
jgi:drug/metabolite transporter (DMT)-like permease